MAHRAFCDVCDDEGQRISSDALQVANYLFELLLRNSFFLQNIHKRFKWETSEPPRQPLLEGVIQQLEILVPEDLAAKGLQQTTDERVFQLVLGESYAVYCKLSESQGLKPDLSTRPSILVETPSDVAVVLPPVAQVFAEPSAEVVCFPHQVGVPLFFSTYRPPVDCGPMKVCCTKQSFFPRVKVWLPIGGSHRHPIQCYPNLWHLEPFCDSTSLYATEHSLVLEGYGFWGQTEKAAEGNKNSTSLLPAGSRVTRACYPSGQLAGVYHGENDKQQETDEEK